MGIRFTCSINNIQVVIVEDSPQVTTQTSHPQPGNPMQLDILDRSMIPCNTFSFHPFFLNFVFLKIFNQVYSKNCLSENINSSFSKTINKIKRKPLVMAFLIILV